MNYSIRDINNLISKKTECCIKFYATPAGWLRLYIVDHTIIESHFMDELQVHKPIIDDIQRYALLLNGTDFQIKVWQALLQIPRGSIVSYQELAVIVGSPRAWRAVARAVASNSIAYFIPCHRIVRKDGNLGGYRWGIERKKLLILSEQ